MKLIKKSLSFITAIACCAAISGIMPFSSSAEDSGTYGDLSYTKVDLNGDGTYDYISISGCKSSAVEVDIPAKIEGLPVATIGIYAFAYCESLTSITIPESISQINIWAFKDCLSLISINIPDNVVYISSSAFYGCKSLTDINVTENNKYYSSSAGLLFDKNKTELIKYPAGKSLKNFNIPNGVKSLDRYSFCNCSNLTLSLIHI